METLFVLFAALLLAVQAAADLSECQVSVSAESTSWPSQLIVPPNSTVKIYCRLANELNPLWAIDLAEDATVSQLQFSSRGEILNEYGVFKLLSQEAPGMPPTLGLLINDTERNNQTVIVCDGVNDFRRTTLLVQEPTQFDLDAVDIKYVQQSVNISWSPKSSSANLTVTSANSDSRTLQVNQAYYVFEAPPNAPPCEVYNFSVTATPVGATYTGDGCSVPSSVLSRMLPSLPDITPLAQSQNFSLQKLEPRDVQVEVYFQPATYCEDYPVTNYTLECVDDSMKIQFTSEETIIVATNLSENTLYQCTLYALNSVGNVSTGYTKDIYTTDVQSVTVSEVEGGNSVAVHCDFIPGSDALGCVVILVGEVTNTTVMVDRDDTTGVGVASTELPLPLGCYRDVIAFDVEADGSNGTLPISGTLVRDTDDRVKCVPTKETPLKDNSKSLVEGIVVPVIAIMLIAITIAVVVILIFHVKLKRSRNSLDISPPGSLDGKVEEGPLYAFPVKVKKVKSKLRSEGDGAEISDKLDQENKVEADDTHQVCCLLNGNVNQGAAIDDDFMPDPDAPELPPPYNPDLEDSQACPIYDEIATKPSPKKSKLSNAAYPGPIYQDVLELSSSREDQAKLKGDVQQASHNAVGQDTLPVNPLPVYQDVAELTTEDAPLITGTSTLACPVLSSNTTRDLPPPIHVQPSDQRGLVIESSEGSCGMRLQATNVSTHTRSHPTTLPIYQHIADSAEVVANITCHDNVGNHYDTLGSPTTPPDTSSSTALTPYTPDPLPTPIYEDIDKVVSTVREETNTSVELSRPNDDSTSPETGDQTSSDKPTGTLV